MSRPSHIAPDLTVRQVATAWPACTDLLAPHPGSRRDDRWTLQELAPFARAHGLDPSRLLAQLATVAAVPLAPTRQPREDSPIPLVFVALLVGLSLGAGWGVLLLLRIALGADYAVVSAPSVHVHGVAQFWGWVAMFVIGIGAHLLRQNTRNPAPPWLDRLAAGAIVAALLAFFAGLAAPVRAAIPYIDAVASALLVAAALAFGVSVAWSLLGRGQRPLPWHRFVLAAVGWLWAWSAIDLVLRLRHAALPVLPDDARDLLIALPVLGFAANAIYGFGIRLIPGLLNIPRLRPRSFTAALVLHNLGLALFLLTPAAAGGATGTLLMLAAALCYLIGLDRLRSKPSRPIHGVDPRGHVLVRAAFCWLLAGLAMILAQQLVPGDLPHAYAGAWRHALTVGFITTMILGVGHRVVPIFIRQPLASNRLMLASTVLILAGNAGRVGLELLTIGGWPWSFRLMGATGLLELTALSLFTLNLALTVRNRRHVYAAGEPLTPDTRVRDAVNARPDLQHRLAALGITMFDDAPFIAPSMTFGALALASGMRPADLLAALDRNDAAEVVPGQSSRPSSLVPLTL